MPCSSRQFANRRASLPPPASGETTVTWCFESRSCAMYVGEQRHRGEVVDREVEEALDLAGVQVDGDDAVGAGDREHVGDQPRGDRLATLGLPVLARVPVERAHRGDALRRRALRRVDHDQLLHDPVVDRIAVALEHEHVGAADALAVPAVELAVGEARAA